MNVASLQAEILNIHTVSPEKYAIILLFAAI